MNFYRGVAMSSDVYFYYLAGGYIENGKRRSSRASASTGWPTGRARFGLGAKTGIDLPGESEGIVPDPAWKEETFGEAWTDRRHLQLRHRPGLRRRDADADGAGHGGRSPTAATS